MSFSFPTAVSKLFKFSSTLFKFKSFNHSISFPVGIASPSLNGWRGRGRRVAEFCIFGEIHPTEKGLENGKNPS